MVLEGIALAVLGAVLLVKYGTSSQIVKLTQRQSKLANQCQQYHARLRSLAVERKAAEGKERHAQTNLAKLETELEAVRTELSELEARNRDLQERTRKI